MYQYILWIVCTSIASESFSTFCRGKVQHFCRLQNISTQHHLHVNIFVDYKIYRHSTTSTSSEKSNMFRSTQEHMYGEIDSPTDLPRTTLCCSVTRQTARATERQQLHTTAPNHSKQVDRSNFQHSCLLHHLICNLICPQR